MGRISTSSNPRRRQRIPTSGSPSLSSVILGLSPVGYWKLDESSGTTAADSTANARNGTYTGTGYTLGGAAGPDGRNYVDLGNAASSHIAIADNDVFSATTNSGLTVFALVKPDSVSSATQRQIVSKFNTSNYEWAIYLNTTASRLQATLHINTGNAMQGEYVDALTAGAWQAVAFGVATPVFNQRFDLYRNSGTPSSTQVAGLTNNNNGNGSAQVWIGWRQDGSANQFWQGGIAHVAIFAGRMSNSNMQSIMDAAQREGWF